MGKRFNAERLKKKLNARYNIDGLAISGAALMEHDEAVRNAYRQELRARMQKEAEEIGAAREAIARDYISKLQEEFESGITEQDEDTMVSYLLAVSTRVLIEQFGWKPIRYANCRKTKTERFVECVVDEIRNIREDETKDIRDYASEVEELYGVRFKMGEEE